MAFVVPCIGPYHDARMRAAASRLKVAAIEIAGNERENIWMPTGAATDAYPRSTLFPQADVASIGHPDLVRRLTGELASLDPRAVAIPGWFDRSSLVALGWCLRQGIPAVLLSESTVDDAARSRLREALKGRVVKSFASALVGGSRHASYLVSLGVPRDHVVLGYDVVDNQHFSAGAAAARQDPAGARARLRLPDRYYVCVGRMIAKKDHATAIAAYRLALQRRPDLPALLLVGDGPLHEQTARQIAGLEGRVVLYGAASYRDLPAIYALSHAFIHPSRVEQWGLVVNEAMACGAVPIVSTACGCIPDLVRDGTDGWTFPPGAVDVLCDLILTAATDPGRTAAMGAAAQRSIAAWSPQRFGDGIAAAVGMARPKAISWLDRTMIGMLAAR